MVLVALLCAPALALSWYAPTDPEAAALRAALDDVWPGHEVQVITGPPLPEDPDGAVWWDGQALQLSWGEDRRAAPGVSDPSVQVALVRGWLVREAPAVEAPPEPLPIEELDLAPLQDPAAARSSSTFSLGSGPTLRLPDPGLAWTGNVLIGGRRGRLVGGTLISLELGESDTTPAGGVRLASLCAELAPGLALEIGPRAELWLLGTFGSRGTFGWAQDNAVALEGDERAWDSTGTLLGGLGLQVLVDTGEARLGARARVSTTLGPQDAALNLEDVSVPLRPGTVALELVWAPGSPR